ncbi:hypothetical protein [Sphingopyxis sp.]
MARIAPESNWIQRVWSTIVDTSAAAVAVHYRAPWTPAAKR